MTFAKRTAPYIRRKGANSKWMMIDVLIALLPIVIYSLVVYRLYALRSLLIAIGVMELCEFVGFMIKNRIPYDGEKHTFREQWKHMMAEWDIKEVLVPLVSAVIFALISPVDTDPGYLYPWVLITGAVFGLVLGKIVFGGTGMNIFNPAAVGMVFDRICFGSHFITVDPFASKASYAATGTFSAMADEVITSPTPLSTTFFNPVYTTDSNGYLVSPTINLRGYSMLDLFLGKIPGLMGEVCKLLILVALVYLIVRHAIDWRIPLAYIGSLAVIMLFAGIVLQGAGYDVNAFRFVAYQILSGGLLFAAVFMATDPVTSPMTAPGRVIYGIILGSTTSLIRLFGAYSEGVAYSLLIANMLTPMIDYYKWSSCKWNWKKITIAASILVVVILITIWALSAEVY